MKFTKQVRQIITNPVAVLPIVVTLLVAAQSAGTIAVVFLLPDAPPALKLLCVIGVALLVLGGALFAARRWFGATWQTFKLQRPSEGWARRLAAGAGIYVAISLTLLIMATVLLPGFNSGEVQDVGLQDPTGWQLLPGFLALVIFTPIFEEIVFRGILFAGLRRRSGFYVAAAFSAVVFAFLHGQWNVAIDTFALGLVLAYLVEKTNSIVPGMILHALKNFIAFSALFIIR